MRSPVTDKWDREELERLNAEPWMVELLEVNPDYPHWGPHEDYMRNNRSGWSAPAAVPTWSDFGWTLDDMNEVVHFYFEVRRDSVECATCAGGGYHPEAQPVANSFYAQMNREGESWNDKIAEDEVLALWEAGRLRHDFKELPTAEQVNAWQRGRGLGHDAINRCTLIEARLKRLGLPKDCPTCDGHGYTFTEDAAHAGLVLWVIHPRKGASRGVEIERVDRADLPAIRAFLDAAARRNAARFARITKLPEEPARESTPTP